MKYIRPDGTMRLCLVTPGQGSSAFYEEEVLERDARKAFSGALSFFDHPTAVEGAARPERSVRDLLGKVVSEPAFDRKGPNGAGVYADLYVLKEHRETVDELAALGGWSIRAAGRKGTKAIGGKETVVATELLPGPLNSVDLVTRGARGGAAVPLAESLSAVWLRESAGNEDPAAYAEWAIARERTGDSMELKEALERVAALEKENATLVDSTKRLTEALALRDGKALIEAQVATEAAKLPDVTRARLVESLVGRIPVKDGKLDDAGLKVLVSESITAEAEYVAKIAPTKAGISGMGQAPTVGSASFKESLKAAYMRNGMAAERAEQLAEVAANGGR